MEGTVGKATGKAKANRRTSLVAHRQKRLSVYQLKHERKCRDEELNEARQQQVASAEILKVINASPGDLTPVFDIILEKAHSLCDVPCGSLQLFDNDHTRAVAVRGLTEPFEKFLRNGYRLDRSQPVQSIRPFQLDKLAKAVAGVAHDSALRVAYELGGLRTILSVPLVRDGFAFGRIVAGRLEERPFSDHQVALLQSFADQAVIAIENARLFDEVQAKTRDLMEALTYQTGSANILRVIASSPTNVVPVLQAIVESACELCGAYDALLRLRNGENLDYGAHHGPIPVSQTSMPINRQWTAGLAMIEKRPVRVSDLLTQEGDAFPEAQDLARRFGHRTILTVPLLREDESIGAIILRRTEVRPFSDKQVALLQTFADQAVIAIGNVRLFEEVQARTLEVSRSLEDLHAAQDRLIQTEKLASLGQLTAGIAHEIKNPLNFINNFSAVSAELIEEMNGVLAGAQLEKRSQEQMDELAQMLKGNLEKIVQHGKRADSIVKNMLLHSREGSGERRLADINAIVEESLNLAYHGARAENSGFNITIRRDLDEDTGVIELHPQEITRVLLNLISNAFYAARKRKEEAENGFEPTLTASTKSFANRVEIRIRDNGIGIPEEIKAKIFNPFFTTKPAGQGTGLGLSMSYDIIVKQHGGTIDIDTEPSVFTEFIVTLPRTTSAQNPERSAN